MVLKRDVSVLSGQCEVPVIPNAPLIRGRHNAFVDHNSTVEYRCQGGLVTREGPVMRCANGTWTHKIECGPGKYMIYGGSFLPYRVN